MTTPNPHSSTTTGQGPAGANGGASAPRLADQATEQGRHQAEALRERSAHTAETLADSLRSAASQLRGDDIGNVSDHVAHLADGLARCATDLREKSGSDLIGGLTRVARENPGLFLAGSVAVGFGLSRFTRAGSQRGQSSHESAPATVSGGTRPADTYSDRVGTRAPTSSAAGSTGDVSSQLGSGAAGAPGTGAPSGTYSGAGLGGMGGAGGMGGTTGPNAVRRLGDSTDAGGRNS